MENAEFYQAAIAVVPLLLLTMVQEKRMDLFKSQVVESCRQQVAFIGAAVVIGWMVVNAMLAMGALLRDADPTPLRVSIVASVGAGFAAAAWTLGWAVWRELEERPKGWTKNSFFAVGLCTVLGVACASGWALWGNGGAFWAAVGTACVFVPIAYRNRDRS